MEPFLAMAMLFRKHGWQVRCGMPAQFESLATEHDLPFSGFDPRFLNLIEGKEGREIMGQKGSVFKRIISYSKLARQSFSLQGDMMREQQALVQKEQPDLIIYHGKCIYPLIWGMHNPGKTIMMSAMPCIVHPVDEYPNVGMRIKGGPRVNRWTYRFYSSILSTIVKRMGKYVPKQELDKQLMKKSRIRDFILNQQPYFYAISPSVFKRPADWPNNVKITGFRELAKAQDYVPPAELSEFLDRHAKVLFVSFGSMINSDPAGKTRAIVSLLEKHDIPAIINTSWGGLDATIPHPEHVLFVQNIPYDWLFPKVYAVIHHGGSGTTHTGLKNGCATLIIPHIVDQFFWNKTVAKLGAGPLGMPIKKLNEANLEEKLLDLWLNQDYKTQAQALALKMTAEDFEEEIMAIPESQQLQ